MARPARAGPARGPRCATAFLDRALAWFAARGVTIERAMTDNGSAYRSKLFRRTLATRAVRHIFTRR